MLELDSIILNELAFNTDMEIGKEKPYAETVAPCVGFVLPSLPNDKSKGEE